MADDFYALLGVASDASVEEIKLAYRKLAGSLHPDRNPSPDVEARFKDITLAYQTLSSVARRRRYDEERVKTTHTVVLWKGPPKKARGEDLSYRLEVPFSGAMLGVVIPIQVPRKATCGECDGSGAALERAPSRIPPCADCGGRGKIADGGRRSRSCPRCQGRGLEPIEACTDCGGEGRREQTDSLDVPIPGGIENGRRLRLAGWGDDGPASGDTGNLYVVVTVTDHPLLARDGDDVVCQVPIALTEALLGADVRIPTLEGAALLTVPPGSATGAVLKLKGKGVLRPDGKRGDQRVTLDVVIPGELDEAQRQALQTFAAARPPAREARIQKFQERVDRLYGRK